MWLFVQERRGIGELSSSERWHVYLCWVAQAADTFSSFSPDRNAAAWTPGPCVSYWLPCWARRCLNMASDLLLFHPSKHTHTRLSPHFINTMSRLLCGCWGRAVGLQGLTSLVCQLFVFCVCVKWLLRGEVYCYFQENKLKAVLLSFPDMLMLLHSTMFCILFNSERERNETFQLWINITSNIPSYQCFGMNGTRPFKLHLNLPSNNQRYAPSKNFKAHLT